jgi:integrase
MFTAPDGRALNRNRFNEDVWRPAREAAGLADDRVNGCHMMRHVFASKLVSRGVDARTVAEYMGHTDGGVLVLKTYSHLMPDAEDWARRAIEDALAADEDALAADGPETYPKGAQARDQREP